MLEGMLELKVVGFDCRGGGGGGNARQAVGIDAGRIRNMAFPP